MSSQFDELAIGANVAQVRHASAWLVTACRQRNVPQVLAERLELCLNEVLANVINHGGLMALSVPIKLLLEVALDQDAGTAGVTVSDAGMAFNPLSAPEQPMPKTLHEASPGGLGLVTIRHCCDWLRYCHEDGRNHLTFGTRWSL